jgi:hypothetical protein
MAAEIGNRDDRELEALRRVDRHHPDAVVLLGLGRGLAFSGRASRRLLEVVQEAP